MDRKNKKNLRIETKKYYKAIGESFPDFQN